jgi:tetratricopeptide (TPR) repeat protein
MVGGPWAHHAAGAGALFEGGRIIAYRRHGCIRGRVVLAALTALLLVGPTREAMAEGAEPEELAKCQDDQAAPRLRIESCSRLIEDAGLISDIRAEAFLNRGIALDGQGEHLKAVADLTEAIKLNPDYPALYFYRGIARDNAGQSEPAIADFSDALRRNPDNTDALVYRGAAYLAVGEHDKAIADFNLALKLEPGDAAVMTARGEAFEGKGDKASAIEDYRAALGLEPDNEDAAKGLKRLGAKP